MADDRELQRKAVEFRLLQERGAALQAQLGAVKGLLDEVENASKALAAISSPEAKDSVLFPLGSGVIVRAKPFQPGSVLVEEGSGIVLEKSAGDALKQLEERKKKLVQAFDSYQMELARISERFEELRAELSHYR